MTTCPSCQQPASKRDGHDPAGRQRYACRPCGRDFTARSGSAFAGSRWPPQVILLGVLWSLSHPLSATSVMELLAERGIDVSQRTVLRWVQTFEQRRKLPVKPPQAPGQPPEFALVQRPPSARSAPAPICRKSLPEYPSL